MSVSRTSFSQREKSAAYKNLNFLRTDIINERIDKIDAKDKAKGNREYIQLTQELLLTMLFLIKFFDDLTNSANRHPDFRQIVSNANKTVKLETNIKEFIDGKEYFDLGTTFENFHQEQVITTYVDINALVIRVKSILDGNECKVTSIESMLIACIGLYKYFKIELESIYNSLVNKKQKIAVLPCNTSMHLEFFENFLANNFHEHAFLKTNYINQMVAEVRALSEEEAIPALIAHFEDIRSAMFCARQLYRFATDNDFDAEDLSAIPENLLAMSQNITVSENDTELSISLKKHSETTWTGPACLDHKGLEEFYYKLSADDSESFSRLSRAVMQVKKIIMAVSYQIQLLENGKPLEKLDYLKSICDFSKNIKPEIRAFGDKVAAENPHGLQPLMAIPIKQLDSDTQTFKDKLSNLRTSIIQLDKNISDLERKYKDFENVHPAKNKRNKKRSEVIADNIAETIELEIVSPFKNQKGKINKVSTMPELTSIANALKKIRTSCKTTHKHLDNLISTNSARKAASKTDQSATDDVSSDDSECSSDESLNMRLDSVDLSASTASPISKTYVMKRATSAPVQSRSSDDAIKEMLVNEKPNVKISRARKPTNGNSRMITSRPPEIPVRVKTPAVAVPIVVQPAAVAIAVAVKIPTVNIPAAIESPTPAVSLAKNPGGFFHHLPNEPVAIAARRYDADYYANVEADHREDLLAGRYEWANRV